MSSRFVVAATRVLPIVLAVLIACTGCIVVTHRVGPGRSTPTPTHHGLPANPPALVYQPRPEPVNVITLNVPG